MSEWLDLKETELKSNDELLFAMEEEGKEKKSFRQQIRNGFLF